VNLDSNESRYVINSVSHVAQFLLQKNRNKFDEVENKTQTLDEFLQLVLDIYSMQLMDFAAEYFQWADRRALNSSFSFSSLETEHFLFYYPTEVLKDEMDFIASQSEKVYQSLFKTFEPDSSMMTNFQRLYVFDTWRKGNFREASGDLLPTDSRLPILIVGNRNQLSSVTGRQPDDFTQADADFRIEFLPEKNQVVYPWLAVVPYNSPLSFLILTHYVTHLFVALIYSRPEILDLYITEHNSTALSNVPQIIFAQSFAAADLLTFQGTAVWAGFEFTPLTKSGLLPNSRRIMKYAGRIIPLADLVRGAFDITDLNAFFLASGSFIGFLMNTASKDQLKQLFRGSANMTLQKKLEQSLGSTIRKIELDWKNWME